METIKGKGDSDIHMQTSPPPSSRSSVLRVATCDHEALGAGQSQVSPSTLQSPWSHPE